MVELSVHDFVLGEELGNGTSSIVYKSSHPIYGNCAIKSIFPQYEFCVQEELAFLVCVQGHQNFTRVYDVWNEGKKWYIAMELMDGTLYDKIHEGMDINEIVNATIQLSHALSYLHSKKIVHFDLKPENIGYVINNGVTTYKILDFGTSEFFSTVYSSRFQQNLYNKEIVKTSKWYRAYETICIGTYFITEKVDEWSLGCIIYEMITGTPLFDKLDDSEEYDENLKVLYDGLENVENYLDEDHIYHSLYIYMYGLLDVNPDLRLNAI